MPIYGLKITPKDKKRGSYLRTDGTLTRNKGEELVARFTTEDRAQLRIDRERENWPGAEIEIVEVPDWAPGHE